jgi:hypothetical protein
MLSSASAVIAQDLDLKVDAGAGAGAEIGESVGIDAGVDAMTTGSIDSNFGSLVSTLEADASAGAQVDLSAYSDSSTLNCVTVSSLDGAAEGDAALDAALASGADRMTSLQGEIDANGMLWTDIQASCSSIADLQLEDVIAVESDANGVFTVYVDDRA